MWTPEFQPDFPTLFIVPEWVHRHCIVPDGFEKGQQFGPVGWQQEGFLNFYRLKPSAVVGELAPAFFYRRSQIVLPQKAGKAPYTAAHICNEAVGPALFAGWARGGETWDCRDHGCGCGWVYEYQPGEAMGQPWPTPLIQITATSEDQTDNIYDALRPMIDDGPLSVLIPKTGEEFIRLPNKGRIDVVTSNARSRLGQRVTFVPQDETGVWTASVGMIKVAETQRRGLAGMGGRAEETTNAWDPNEDSVAQRTANAAEESGDIFRIHPVAPRHLSYRNKAERRKIHRHVYEGCHWVNLDGIEGEVAELIKVDPGQAERFFGNNPTAGSGLAFDVENDWVPLAKPRSVAKLETIVVGVDGAQFRDALAIIATDVRTGYSWTADIIERPADASDDYRHDKRRADGVIAELFERFIVWRMYCDDQYIEDWVRDWQNKYGEKRVIFWPTNRWRQVAWAVRNFEQAIAGGDISHDGNRDFRRHMENTHKRLLTVLDDKERRMHTLCKESQDSEKKIDAAMAAVLAWEARGDAVAAGVSLVGAQPQAEAKPPDVYRADYAPSMPAFAAVGPSGGMSDME